MSAVHALPTRDADSTFGPNIEAELSKVRGRARCTASLTLCPALH